MEINRPEINAKNRSKGSSTFESRIFDQCDSKSLVNWLLHIICDKYNFGRVAFASDLYFLIQWYLSVTSCTKFHEDDCFLVILNCLLYEIKKDFQMFD